MNRPAAVDESDAAAVLHHPEISGLLERNENKRQPIEAAAVLLAGERDPVAAVKKAAQIHLRDTIRVFFSFKLNEGEKAKRIVETLRGLSNRIDIRYAYDFKERNVGMDYVRQIDAEIKDADWLILLLPDPAADWDWCLYETGIFRGQMVSNKIEKLICLHHEMQEPPDQIRQFQAVPGNLDSVLPFLKQVYLNDNPIPGMRPLKSAESLPQIERAARKIVDIIRPPMNLARTHYDSYVFINPRAPQDVQSPGDLDDAAVIEVDEIAQRNIFGKSSTPATWGELVSNLIKDDPRPRWLEQLSRAVHRAGNGDAFAPIRSTLQGCRDGKMYQPVLHAADRDHAGNFHGFHIILVEEVGAPATSAIPRDLLTLATSLRLGFRFRWEILEVFNKPRLQRKELARMRGLIEGMNAEAYSRGLLDRDSLMSLFEGDDLQALEEMFDYWARLMRPDGSGELDRALGGAGNVKATKLILRRLDEMNRDFLRIASRRFSGICEQGADVC